MATKTTVKRPVKSGSVAFTLRTLGVIERVGNRLPHPFWLFVILSGFLLALSWGLHGLGVSAESPKDGATIAVRSLISDAGVTMMLDGLIENYATFPPLGVVLVVMLGVSVADQAGMLTAMLRAALAKVPAKAVTFMIALTGMVAHIASDAAFVVMIPLGAIAYRSVGRNPVLGAVVAFVSVSGGHAASPLVTPSDATLAALTTAAAQTIDSSYTVTPVANYFFSLASSVVLALVITLVAETLLTRRLAMMAADDAAKAAEAGTRAGTEAGTEAGSGAEAKAGAKAKAGTEAKSGTGSGTGGGSGAETGSGAEELPDLSLTGDERRGLRAAALTTLALVAAIAVAALPAGSPLRGEHGAIIDSPLVHNIAVFLSLIFFATGIAYGRAVGAVRTAKDVPEMMAAGLRELTPVLVLFFAISQFLAYFKWTSIGEVMAISGAELLDSSGVPIAVIFVGVILVVSVMNLLLTSGSAMWALIGPVFVPMLMLMEVAPETTWALFRIADSCTNPITPMSPYFALCLGFVRRYRPTAGIGTLMSLTLPVALSMLVVWTLLFLAWYFVGLPFGPGAPTR
ncbi:AbgT family transporter [Streptomyces sp. NBC_01775]|uniref:AbgT family transporter n=1 Tax=Streptomyces sp. NBC_01775 TaxID=2975939 RepID=UPI002DDA6EE2|nr:AbgT family transporter [Streptomyces sp. NBC_01775]WSB77458.1 AbgT family transporter [Streptomyces sp. NBC_01775]